MAAQISIAHGNLREASSELYEAHDLDPESPEINEYMELLVRLKKPIYERNERRHREHEKQSQLEAQKYMGKFHFDVRTGRKTIYLTILTPRITPNSSKPSEEGRRGFLPLSIFNSSE